MKLKPKKYYEGILYLGILQTKNNKQTIFKREYNIKKIELFWYSIKMKQKQKWTQKHQNSS